MPRASLAAAANVAVENAEKMYTPTLIGEVGLKTRSMCKKRSGRLRSAIKQKALTAQPPAAATIMTRASSWFFAARWQPARVAAVPAIPPVKKYTGIRSVHAGGLTIGRP